MLTANFYILKSLIKLKICLALGFFLIFSLAVYGQNQVVADSLQTVYNSGNFDEKDRLRLLFGLARNHQDPEKILLYSDELLR
ncbi:MAG: adenylate/guanylate cyclase domain-containing protein, partial [Eudoraea sp.]